VAERHYAAPVVLTTAHDLSSFACGEQVLDEWLRDRALDNLKMGASRTYVSCPEGSTTVVGYYALAMGGILGADVPGSMRRNMPRVIPAVMLGRLAVDQKHQGHRLGGSLLNDAVQRSIRAAADVSARLMVVHALTPAAEAFYTRNGFQRLPTDAPTLALDLVKVAAIAAGKG
jgi:GNAT superfamily N-acetyltransferase